MPANGRPVLLRPREASPQRLGVAVADLDPHDEPMRNVDDSRAEALARTTLSSHGWLLQACDGLAGSELGLDIWGL